MLQQQQYLPTMASTLPRSHFGTNGLLINIKKRKHLHITSHSLIMFQDES